jgi:hypothetical protein
VLRRVDTVANMPTIQYKCPDKDCPPTDFEPVEVTSNEDEERMVICAGCSKTYPLGMVKPVLQR